MLIEFLSETLSSEGILDLLNGADESRSLEELGTASSWSSYTQFRRLLEERGKLDPTSLHENKGLLSSWLKTSELAGPRRHSAPREAPV